MKHINVLIALAFLIASCMGINSGDIAYKIPEKDLIPEGITYSEKMNAFYISSIYKTKIVKINAETGDFIDFIPSALLNMRFLGLITDENRNHLWACGNMTSGTKRHSSVIKFNLTTGELLKSYYYPDSIASTYNDLALDNAGNVYFTNSNGQRIYRINNQSDPVEVFYEGSEIIYPNGIALSPDNTKLYIASDEKGIRVLDIEKRKIIDDPDSSINSLGIDGLKYYKNSLIGIQNSGMTRSEWKIAQYFIDETGTKITRMKIIDQGHPSFDIPTTFVIVDNQLYCLANSQLQNLTSDNNIKSLEALNDIIILKYNLE